MKAHDGCRRCRCGFVHLGDQWNALPGRTVLRTAHGTTIEMRRCWCGKPLATEITLSGVITGLRGWMVAG